jgi:hypothetical protein
VVGDEGVALDAIDERVRADGEVGAITRRVEVGERHVPADAADHVDRVEDHVAACALRPGGMPWRQVGLCQLPRAQHFFCTIEVRLERGV